MSFGPSACVCACICTMHMTCSHQRRKARVASPDMAMQCSALHCLHSTRIHDAAQSLTAASLTHEARAHLARLRPQGSATRRPAESDPLRLHCRSASLQHLYRPCPSAPRRRHRGAATWTHRTRCNRPCGHNHHPNPAAIAAPRAAWTPPRQPLPQPSADPVWQHELRKQREERHEGEHPPQHDVRTHVHVPCSRS